MSTTKRKQEKTDWFAVGVFAAIFLIFIIAGGFISLWVYGWQEKWRDTGVVLSKNKFLDQSPGSQCCNFIFNYTILTDHHGLILWTSNENCLGINQNDTIFHVTQIVGIKACNNGLFEIHGDP